jgi:hypothetical protein
VLDAQAPVEAAGEDADTHLPGLRTHLQGCPACREDHESLLALVLADRARAGPIRERPSTPRKSGDEGRSGLRER